MRTSEILISRIYIDTLIANEHYILRYQFVLKLAIHGHWIPASKPDDGCFYCCESQLNRPLSDLLGNYAAALFCDGTISIFAEPAVLHRKNNKERGFNNIRKFDAGFWFHRGIRKTGA